MLRFIARYLPLCLLSVLIHWTGGDAAQADETKRVDQRPNLLFIMADDQRNDTLGCAGHPIVKTPNIDQLARFGIRFENMFVTSSICWVSRATILTGRHARSFGSPTDPDRVQPGKANDVYPKMLKEAGYRTGFLGKWHARMPKGFKRQDHFDFYRDINRGPYFKKQADGSQRHTTQLIGDGACEFIENHPADKPFCLTLWFNAGHAEDHDHRPGIGHFPWPKVVDGMYEDVQIPAPRLADENIFASQPKFLKESLNRKRFHWRWDTPEKYQTNMRAYYRMLSGIDHVVGRAVEQLKKRGLQDNTVIIYTADNGYYMGDRGFAGKWSHYEESLRVPLIIFDPRTSNSWKASKSDDESPANNRPRNVSIFEMAVNVDLPSTLLDYAGVEIPTSYEGRSLRPLVGGNNRRSGSNNVGKRWREDFFCEHVFLAPNITWEGVRTKRYKYARYFDQNPVYEFLHDLDSDPNETKNLADSKEHAEILSRLRARTDELVNKYGAPLAPQNKRRNAIRRKAAEQKKNQ